MRKNQFRIYLLLLILLTVILQTKKKILLILVLAKRLEYMLINQIYNQTHNDDDCESNNLVVGLGLDGVPRPLAEQIRLSDNVDTERESWWPFWYCTVCAICLIVNIITIIIVILCMRGLKGLVS